MDEQVKQQLMHGELAQRVNAMARICDGMSPEDMEQAPFTYKALLEIVQRREVRESLTARPEGV